MTQVKYSDLVDIAKLQALLESFNEVLGIANAVIDVDGSVIASAGWQDVCTGYHRVNADTCRRCIESDTSLVESMTRGAPYAIYRCLNGLVDTAAPIMVEGVHLANVFTGQFLTEAPDVEFFRRQARQFGFDEARYLEAISRVPVLHQGQAESLTRLYAKLAGMLADSGADRLAQKETANKLASLNIALEETVARRTEALLESETRFRLMFEHNDSIMLLIDPQSGNIVDANAAASRFYGYSIAQLKAMRIDQINTLSASEITALLVEAAQHQRNFFVFPHRVAGGEVRTVEVRSSSLDIGGRVLLFSIIHDITERRRAEEALAAREIELSTIIETEPECVKRLAADGSLLHMNRAGLEMIEADSLEQVLGNQMQQLLLPKHRHAFMALTKRVFAGGSGTLSFEICGLRGGHRWLETHAAPLRNPAGQITALLGVTRDITKRKQMEEQVRQMAFYDPLTKLPNRRLLTDRLLQALAANKRSGCYGALMFLDLDNFKPLNDSHGHEVGDLLLVEVADRLKACIREMDTVARFGGDEFVVVLRDLKSDRAEAQGQAQQVAEKIRGRLSEPYRLDLREGRGATGTILHRCTATIGVALFIDHETSHELILKWADTAMYRAKEAGRNCICFHDGMA